MITLFVVAPAGRHTAQQDAWRLGEKGVPYTSVLYLLCVQRFQATLNKYEP